MIIAFIICHITQYLFSCKLRELKVKKINMRWWRWWRHDRGSGTSPPVLRWCGYRHSPIITQLSLWLILGAAVLNCDVGVGEVLLLVKISSCWTDSKSLLLPLYIRLCYSVSCKETGCWIWEKWSNDHIGTKHREKRCSSFYFIWSEEIENLASKQTWTITRLTAEPDQLSAT